MRGEDDDGGGREEDTSRNSEIAVTYSAMYIYIYIYASSEEKEGDAGRAAHRTAARVGSWKHLVVSRRVIRRLEEARGRTKRENDEGGGRQREEELKGVQPAWLESVLPRQGRI